MNYFVLLMIYTVFSVSAVEASHSENIEEHTAKVTVWQEIVSGKTRYHYSVLNEAEKTTITTIKVGFDYFHGIPLLKTQPDKIYSPQGWQSSIVRTEETLDFEIEWRRSHRSYSIQPKQEQSGFIIEVSTADSLFRDTFFTTYFGDSTIASTHIITVAAPPPGDTLAPSLSVTLSPDVIWPPNRKMVDIVATVSAQDNKDPNPVIRLESITCNDCPDTDQDITGATIGDDDRNFSIRAARMGQSKEGRKYTVTYSATDNAGNRKAVEAWVTVPHDQRKPAN